LNIKLLCVNLELVLGLIIEILEFHGEMRKPVGIFDKFGEHEYVSSRPDLLEIGLRQVCA